MSASRFCAALLLFTSLGGGAFAADAPPSPQVLYNQAQSAFDKGDWDNAIDGFNKVLAAMNAGPTSRSRAMINARLARALLSRNRLGEAQQAAQSAIGVLAAATPPPTEELTSAYLTLADAQRYDLRFGDATDSYRRAASLAAPGGIESFNAQVGLTLSTMVTDPSTAVATADALLSNKALVATLPPARLAEFEALKGRAELNRGHPDLALPFVKQAVDHSGGLTEHVTLAQVSIRGDAALVQLKLRHDDKARELLAYTGAGHLPNEDWISSGRTELPQCGGPVDITPQDTVVVEFAIGADGRVSGVAPVYASRPGEMGVAFAKAVSHWRWEPEAIAKVDPFWRASVRLQLRCNVRPAAMSDSFFVATAEWLSANGATDVDIGAPSMESSTKAQVASPGEAQDLSDLLHTMRYDQINSTKHGATATAIEALLSKRAAPPDVRATFRFVEAERYRTEAASSNRDIAQHLADAIPKLEDAPNSARAVAWLKTEMAIDLEQSGDFARAQPVLAGIVALPDSRLTDDDAIRRIATVHLAVVRARLSKGAVAQLAASSLPPDRCSLLDVKPVATNRSISDSTFPDTAMRWGFEGYVREAFDIGRDGRVEGVRTVIAYPPFVFDEATEGAVGQFRYLPPIDSDGAFVGCTNQTIGVKYVIPKP